MIDDPPSERGSNGSGLVLGELLDGCLEAVCIFDDRLCFRYLNHTMREILEHATGRRPVVGQSLELYLNDAERFGFWLEQLTPALEGRTGSFQLARLIDGRHTTFEITARPFDVDGGKQVAVFGVDITERARSEGRLRISEGLFRALVENSWDGLCLFDDQWVVTYASPAVERMLGYPMAEIVGRPSRRFFVPDTVGLARDYDRIEEALATGTSVEVALRHSDGSTRWVEATIRDLLDDPFVGSMVANFRDVTERRRWNQTVLALTEGVGDTTGVEFFQRLVEHLARLLDAPHLFVGELLSGKEEVVRTVAAWMHGKPAENFEFPLAGTPCEGVLKREECVHRRGVSMRFPEDRMLADMGIESYVGIPLKSARGEPVGILAMLDVRPLDDVETTEAYLRLFASRAAGELGRMRSDQALRASEERFRQLAEGVRDVFWLSEVESGRHIYISPAFERVWGFSVASFESNPNAWLDAVHPEDRRRVLEWSRGGAPDRFSECEYRIVHPEGGVRWIRHRVHPIFDSQGQVYRISALAEDLTQRRELESQLRQAQKMEAVGQLAGGVAHDFNNLLTVISGYVDVLQEQIEDPLLREHVREISRAASRAGELTRQLLAYGRKEIHTLQVVDVNRQVTEATGMLRRLIPEDIRLELVLGEDAGSVRADPGRFQQVLVNLAVNARDAMPNGGVLTISTAQIELDPEGARLKQLEPGRYAVVRVCDDGEGMSENVKQHLFDPFFTTKELGRGTGLGLATVYGIVKQSRGHIEVESAPGAGAEFSVLLPCDEDLSDAPHVEGEDERWPHGSETILLVEDEAGVRAYTRFVLERSGYRVLEAANGEAALELSQELDGELDLLITDVVMPGMSGRDLAYHLRQRCGGLRVLYVSGYTDDEVIRRGVVDDGIYLLPKPFTPVALAQRVRDLLDAASDDESDAAVATR